MSLQNSYTVEHNLDLFRRAVPALELLATSYHVGSDVAFTVDRDVQLVCKYLRAYNATLDGSNPGIDKLYSGGEPIKFSKEPNPTAEECNRLLKQFMQKHVSATKVTQLLFIRYENNNNVWEGGQGFFCQL